MPQLESFDAQSPPVHIRWLEEDDAPAFAALRREALRDAPAAFEMTTAEHDSIPHRVFAAQLGAERRSRSGVVGAFVNDRLVGMAGVSRHVGERVQHKTSIWGVFLRPEVRGQGVGRQLVDLLINFAFETWKVRQVTLRVTTEQLPARNLYSSLGFRTVGTEPESLFVDGRFFDEDVLVKTR